jgi:hypothetical protein
MVTTLLIASTIPVTYQARRQRFQYASPRFVEFNVYFIIYHPPYFNSTGPWRWVNINASILYPFGILLSEKSHIVFTNSDEPYFEFNMTGQQGYVQGGMYYILNIAVDKNWTKVNFLIHVPLIPTNKPNGDTAWLGNFTIANTASGSPWPPPP